MGITAFPFTAVIDVPSARILGRDDAGTGSAEALTTAEVLALLSVYTTAQVDSLLSGKSNTGHTHNASAITSGIIATARLATGTASASTYLRGDQTWSAVSAGISSLNGLTDATQAFAVGTTGTDVSFASAAGVHTLNIPDASATARGLVTTGTQTFAGIKTFNADARFGLTTSYQIEGNQARGGIHNSLGFLTGTEFGGYKWTSGNMYATPDLYLERDAANRMGQRRTTNPQAFGVYNTWTSATSFERLNIAWASNVCYIGTEKGSAGGTARDLTLGTDGAVRLVLPAATTSGALYLGPLANNAATGGNARGANAVDLQTTRTDAAQVASGLRSFIGNGYGNRSTNEHSAVLNGNRNFASGVNSTILNGDFNTASAYNASVLAGCRASASRSGQATVGYGGSPYGGQNLNDSSQYFSLVLCTKTIGNTTSFLSEGSTNPTIFPEPAIRSGTGVSCILMVKGLKSDGSVGARFLRIVDIKNVSGTVSLETTPQTLGVDYNPSGIVLAISANNTGKSLKIELTGIEGETWRWLGHLHSLEMAYGT